MKKPTQGYLSCSTIDAAIYGPQGKYGASLCMRVEEEGALAAKTCWAAGIPLAKEARVILRGQYGTGV